MSKEWIRDIEVLAGQKRFVNTGSEAVEIEFDIPFSDNAEPDISTVIIYNLSDGTINDIKRDGYILVNAGYKELKNKANILTGEIEEAVVDWDGLDKIVTITASDGGGAWRRTDFNKTYKEGTKASVIINDLCGAMGYEIVEISPKNDRVYALGKTVTGAASTSLEEIVRDTESKVFINKNRIVIREQAKGYESGFVLNADSGLVGYPTVVKDESGDKTADIMTNRDKKKNDKEKKCWRVVSLLNPRLETDSIIKLESKVISGVFRIKSGRHTEDFNTELLVEEI